MYVGILPVLIMLYIVKYFAADLEVFAEGVCNRISLRSMCTEFAMRNLLASHFVMECVPCFAMQSMYGSHSVGICVGEIMKVGDKNEKPSLSRGFYRGIDEA